MTGASAERRIDLIDHEGGHAVALAGRVIRTPRRNPLAVPTRELAEAIAAEWRAMAKPDPSHMPLTALATTVLDRIAAERPAIEALIATYAETELLCHRAAVPERLAARQASCWQPLLEWFAIAHDAPLAITQGILPRSQPPDSLRAVARLLSGFDPWRLGALSLAVAASGSLVVGVALIEGRVNVDEAFEAAELESTHQIETWGEDFEARRRRAGVRADLDAARRFADRLG